jgi:uncharacterized protein (DUF58 family)
MQLQAQGKAVLIAGLSLAAAGMALGMPSAVLTGCLLLAWVRLRLHHLRSGLHPLQPPWGLHASLQTAENSDPTGRSLRVGRDLALTLRLRLSSTQAGCVLEIQQWQRSDGLVGPRPLPPLRLGTDQQIRLGVQAQTAALHRVVGFMGVMTDALGWVHTTVFVPCPCDMAVLPKALALDLRAVDETRRLSPRSGMGQRPDRLPGTGDELRELRDHQPGDPFKHVAWKASAQRGRLMSRSFERDRTRSLYAVLEVGASLRAGVAGYSALDQAAELVHALSEACMRSHDPFGLTLVDGRVIDAPPVVEGLAAVRTAGRALLDMRQIVAEDLAPMDPSQLSERVAQYLQAVLRVPLPPTSDDPVAQAFRHQRVVMAALARLPERERHPLLRGAEPAQRADQAILRRFCRAAALPLPYRGNTTPTQRVQGLVAGVKTAMQARKGPFALLLISDFRGLGGHLAPLWQACAAAVAAGHRVLVVALREGDPPPPEDPWLDENADVVTGLLRADRAARQQLLDELALGCLRSGAALSADGLPRDVLTAWRS